MMHHFWRATLVVVTLLSCGKAVDKTDVRLHAVADDGTPPDWAYDATWYQIFPERFRNGDSSNDILSPFPIDWSRAAKELREVPLQLSSWTSSWFTFTPEEKQMEKILRGHYPELALSEIQAQIIRFRRYGGDLEGIRQQIPYLKQLGINALYLNPIFDSDSEHRYDTKDYRHVDLELGPMDASNGRARVAFTEDRALLKREKIHDARTWGYTRADKLFMQVVNELQENGIRVVIDGVFNHSAANSAMMEDVARRGQDSPYYGWFDFSYQGEPQFPKRKCKLSDFFEDGRAYPFAAKIKFDAWWDFCYLANHKQGFAGTVFHPGLKKYFYDITDCWFKPKVVDGIHFRGVDGIRLDVYGLVSSEFWKQYRKHVKSIKPDALLVAEEWWDGFDILKGDEVDSVMNYTARTFVESWFINPHAHEKFTPSRANEFVQYRLKNHRPESLNALWTMFSSHDTDRVLSKTIMHNRLLSPQPYKDLNWDHERVNKPDKGASYLNDKPGRLERDFYKSLVGFQFAYMGSPMIYYGDEVGMWGADDPTDRKPMVWADLAAPGQTETRCTPEPGIFCRENPNVQYNVNVDLDLLETVRRLIAARKSNVALRRGELILNVPINVDGAWTLTGETANDRYFIWGFERRFGENSAYYISNQNLEFERQTFSIKTRFPAGSRVQDVIHGQEYDVETGGIVRLTVARDRAVLLIAH